MDHGRRPHVQGVTEWTGLIQGVWGDDGGGIPGESPYDSTWEVGGDATELDKTGRGGRATEFPNDIPGEGRPVELPG